MRKHAKQPFTLTYPNGSVRYNSNSPLLAKTEKMEASANLPSSHSQSVSLANSYSSEKFFSMRSRPVFPVNSVTMYDIQKPKNPPIFI